MTVLINALAPQLYVYLTPITRLQYSLRVRVALVLLLAQAHFEPTECTPLLNGAVETAPVTVVCRTMASLDAATSKLTVVNAAGEPVDMDDSAANLTDPDPKTTSVSPDVAKIRDGVYTVQGETFGHKITKKQIFTGHWEFDPAIAPVFFAIISDSFLLPVDAPRGSGRLVIYGMAIVRFIGALLLAVMGVRSVAVGQ